MLTSRPKKTINDVIDEIASANSAEEVQHRITAVLKNEMRWWNSKTNKASKKLQQLKSGLEYAVDYCDKDVWEPEVETINQGVAKKSQPKEKDKFNPRQECIRILLQELSSHVSQRGDLKERLALDLNKELSKVMAVAVKAKNIFFFETLLRRSPSFFPRTYLAELCLKTVTTSSSPDSEFLQYLCQLQKQVALKWDMGQLAQIYSIIPSKNPLREMFLRTLHQDHLKPKEYEARFSEWKLLHERQKRAIQDHDLQCLGYLCQLAKINRGKDRGSLQAQLFNDIYTEHFAEKMSDEEAREFQLIVLDAFPEKDPAFDRDSVLPRVHQAAMEFYWRFPDERRNLFKNDLQAFYTSFLQKIGKQTEPLKAVEGIAILDILLKYNVGNNFLAEVLAKLDDFDLAVHLIHALKPDALSHLHQIKAKSKQPTATELYFQAIGWAMKDDKEELLRVMRQCFPKVLQQVHAFFKEYQLTYPAAAALYFMQRAELADQWMPISQTYPVDQQPQIAEAKSDFIPSAIDNRIAFFTRSNKRRDAICDRSLGKPLDKQPHVRANSGPI